MRIRTRPILVAVAVCAAIVIAAGGVLELVSSPTFQVFGEIVPRVAALTFDDGPVPGRTAEILAILERHGARATFFVIGEHVAAHPDDAAAIVAAGHQFGNHSWSHARLVMRSPAFVRSDVDRGADAIRAAGEAIDRRSGRRMARRADPAALPARARHPDRHLGCRAGQRLPTTTDCGHRRGDAALGAPRFHRPPPSVVPEPGGVVLRD